MEADGSWPIVWKRERGADVWDEEGRKYLDLNAAFGVAAAKLNALSPLAVLTRGYSITETAGGSVVRDSENVNAGDEINIRLAKGSLKAEVLSTE